MGKAAEKDDEYHVAGGLYSGRSVLLLYVIARHKGNGPELLHFPLGFGEETLLVLEGETRRARPPPRGANVPGSSGRTEPREARERSRRERGYRETDK